MTKKCSVSKKGRQLLHHWPSGALENLKEMVKRHVATLPFFANTLQFCGQLENREPKGFCHFMRLPKAVVYTK